MGDVVHGVMHGLFNFSSNVVIALLNISSRLLMLLPRRSRNFSRRCVIMMKSSESLFWW